MTSLLSDTRAFLADPEGCNESIVVRIKEAIKAAWGDGWSGDMRIAAVTHDPPTVRVYDDFGGWEFATVDPDTGTVSPQITAMEQEEEPVFSTDPAFMVSRLVCDGGCGRPFQLGSNLYTDHDNADYCTECAIHNDECSLTLVSVADRATQLSRDMLTRLLGGA